MNKIKRHVLSLVLLVALLGIPTFAVFAKELGSLTISGPGIKTEMTIGKPDEMIKLEQAGFFDRIAIVKPTENLGEAYHITAHLNLDGKTVPFVQMDYYPISAERSGYVHYTGRLDGESLQAVDQWGHLSKSADTAFRDLMKTYGVELQSAVVTAPQAAAPAVAPAVAPAPVQNPYLMPILVLAGLILIGVVLAMRRRIFSQRSA